MTAPGRLYLALDQGGHASRALVIDEHGSTIGAGVRAVDVFHPQPDWVEHDPESVVDSLRAAIDEAIGALGDRVRDIAAAGIATQRSSIVCWDRQTGEALSPVISWQDRRAHDALAPLSAHAARIHALTGLRITAHYGATKLRWCLDNLPAVAAAQKSARLAFAPLVSFLLFRLLGERPFVVDPVNATRTLLFNLDAQDWDEELLALFRVPRSALPSCVANRYMFGTLNIGRAAIPLNVATGDQPAALFARGSPQPDTTYVNMGTGAFIQRVVPRRPDPPPGLLTGMAFSGGTEKIYTVEASVNGAGSALDWAAKTLNCDDLHEHLDAWLAEFSELPLFLNGVSGLGAPYWVADFKSRFVDSENESGQALARRKAAAVAESIVFLLQANLELMWAGSQPKQIIVTGGLSRFSMLCQRLADLSQVSVHRPPDHEATALGVAYLAAGCPLHWAKPGRGTQFLPAPNDELRRRFNRWKSVMDKAVGETSGAGAAQS